MSKGVIDFLILPKHDKKPKFIYLINSKHLIIFFLINENLYYKFR